MKYIVTSNINLEAITNNNSLSFTCPRNSEGSIQFLIENETNISIIVEENAHWTINVEYLKGFIKSKNKIEIKEYASLKHNIIIYENINDIDISQNVEILSNGDYTSALLDVSENNVLFNNQIDLIGEYASSYFRSAIVSNKDAKKIYEIATTNKALYTTSKMDNYGVCKENSKLEFKGIGTIKKGYKQSNNHQNSKIIVFDELSNASVYPLLYIDEYDVLASHSAAVGKVNDEHMYYLCSRGLNEEQAREFITMGYLLPVLNYFLDENIKTKAKMTLERRVINA